MVAGNSEKESKTKAKVMANVLPSYQEVVKLSNVDKESVATIFCLALDN